MSGLLRIRVLGIDPAFANMGFAVADIEVRPDSLKVTPIHLTLISTSGDDRKVVRISSSDLRRAQELHDMLQQQCDEWMPQYAFAEIPHGGALSASAARGLGIAVGIVASCPVPVMEVSPMEVKHAVSGERSKKGLSKGEIIEWAVKAWPDLNWLRHGAGKKITLANEHLADALATIVAGIATPAFQGILPAYRQFAAPESSTRRTAAL